MIKILYYINCNEKDTEVEWLREQKIYPSVLKTINWRNGQDVVALGAIVSEEAAIAIKLRRKLELQIPYKPR